MEKLAALCALWAFGLGSKEDYCKELDRLFLENPDDDFLLELENLGGDCAAIWARISPRLMTADINEFGKALFGKLEQVYRADKIPLREFGVCCGRLWSALPEKIDHKEPFIMLCYADEPLSWGDEEQSRELFGEMIDYYKNEMG
ncbi:MAG: hypothetical protein K2N06_07090 [Oscillospiraceae bacterium]|nr:hypothetical protein [Oscillospiraceae bacterium]